MRLQELAGPSPEYRLEFQHRQPGLAPPEGKGLVVAGIIWEEI